MKHLTKIIIVFVAGFVVCLVTAMFLISPSLNAVNELKSEVKGKKVELAVLDQQIADFKTAQADLANATRKDEISTAIVSKEDLVVAVKELELAAANSKSLHILQISELLEAKDPKSKAQTPVLAKLGSISEVNYNVSTNSDYNGLINFLRYLEHLPHSTEVSNINLTAQTTGSNDLGVINTGGILANIKAVFFVKTPAPTTTTPSK